MYLSKKLPYFCFTPTVYFESVKCIPIFIYLFILNKWIEMIII